MSRIGASLGPERMTQDANTIDAIVGRRIRLRRIELELSIDELACKAGALPEDLADCERGARRVGAPLLLRLAQTLGVPTSYFFRNADSGDSAAAGATADDGIRLLRVFSQIRDPALRDLIIRLTAIMAKVDSPDSQSH